jgi:hypothetical protein
VDLEQREGRIHRYKGHVVRKNLALKYGLLAGGSSDPWEGLFQRAVDERPSDASDITPFWVFDVPGGYKIQRHIPRLPLSREDATLDDLIRTLAIYRLVFGQPRQDDLTAFIQRHLKDEASKASIEKWMINLAPDPCVVGVKSEE